MRTLVYFAADVHLGYAGADPAEREERFLSFLRGIPRDALALYLLGDIWDFWYEYRDVVPREGARVVAELVALMYVGVEVYFFSGNHDIWTYSFFSNLGMHKFDGVQTLRIGEKTFCLGHGDDIGTGRGAYGFMLKVFRSRFARALFSTLHPWIANRIGKGWSKRSRLGKNVEYRFRGASEPLVRFCEDYAKGNPVDFFIFGHYHCRVDMTLSGGSRLLLLKDWMDGSSWLSYSPAEGLDASYL